MAKTKESGAAAPAVKPKKGAEVVRADEFDDLSRLAAEGKKIEDEERARTGSSLTWITCVQPGAGVLSKSNIEEYVKGVEEGDFFIKDRKLRIGEIMRANLLGTFKVYGEIKKAETKNEMAQTVSFWHPDDADNIPLEGNFERPLANGNVLVPMHWVFLEIPLADGTFVDAMLPFRSKGNSYFAAFEKLVKKASDISPQLQVEFKSVPDANNSFKKAYQYPVGSVIGKNFDYDSETGKVSLVKGGQNAQAVRRLLEKYNDLQTSYAGSKVVSRRNIDKIRELIPGNGGKKLLPAGSGTGGYADADEETVQQF